MTDHLNMKITLHSEKTGLVLSGEKVRVETDNEIHEGELVEEDFHGDIVIKNDDGTHTVIPKHRIKHYKTVK